MTYNTRSKKLMGGPQNELEDKPGKENLIAAKLTGAALPPYQSNSSTEDKTSETNSCELKMVIAKTLIPKKLGNINHNLDVFTQNIQEDAAKFNKNSILMVNICDIIKSNASKNEYRVICKIGYGGFSVVWLVIDRKSKEFKVAKVFKYREGISQLEMDTLQQTENHPNILRFYERLRIPCGKRRGCVGIYEPLGKDLNMLMKEESKHGGLSISIVKKVAKQILMALKTIHGLKVVHSDIKPNNIASCVSQLSLRGQLEKIVKSETSLSPLHMVCQQNTEIDENKKRKVLGKELDEVSKLEIKNMTEVMFKLIDFGNAMKEGTESPTGTNGFRPPEYCFGAPLLPSHDIWALGVTIVVLLTNKKFLEFGKSKKIDEIIAIRNMFGKFSRRHFKGFKDPDGYKKKFSTRFYNCKIATAQRRRVLQKKVSKIQMLPNDRNGLIDFLCQMLNTIPSKRKSAAELLSHPWLKDVKSGAKIESVDIARDDRYGDKLNSDNDDGNDLSQKFSDASKTQQRQTIETSAACVAVSSASNCKDTSETPFCQKQAEINDFDSYDYDSSLDETEYGTDSDLDETEEDSNKTISEFGSVESYSEADASYAPPFESFSDDELDELISDNSADISSSALTG